MSLFTWVCRRELPTSFMLEKSDASISTRCNFFTFSPLLWMQTVLCLYKITVVRFYFSYCFCDLLSLKSSGTWRNVHWCIDTDVSEFGWTCYLHLQGPIISSSWSFWTVKTDAASSSYMCISIWDPSLHYVLSLNTWIFISASVRTWNVAQEVTSLFEAY